MPILLTIESGPQANTSLAIEPGKTLRVGRTGQADHAIPEDLALSRVHFEIKFDGQVCRLRDLESSNGTQLNGAPVVESPLKDRDIITAGQSRFRVSILPETPKPPSSLEPPAPPAPPAATPALEVEPRVPETPQYDRLLAVMNSHLQPLYVVINAAQEPAILKVLIEAKVPYQSLFEGEAMYRLVHFAPYLVPLAQNSALLQTMVDSGWTKNWGIFFTSNAAPWELLAFFHRLLLTRMPTGQPALLRYYDPRVLRTLLTSSTSHQLRLLFGPVRMYLMEGDDPEIALGFSLKPQGLEKIELPLTGPEGPTAEIAEAKLASPQSASEHAAIFLPTEEQMALLTKVQRNSFQEELLDELRKLFPRRFEGEGASHMRALVEYGAKRPQRYGIRKPLDVARYIKLMVTLGRDFDADPALPWVASLLGRRLQPAEKLNRLSHAASVYLAQLSK